MWKGEKRAQATASLSTDSESAHGSNQLSGVHMRVPLSAPGAGLQAAVRTRVGARSVADVVYPFDAMLFHLLGACRCKAWERSISRRNLGEFA